MLTTIREEQLLAKFAGEDVAVPQPCTRTEKFLAKMAGLDVQTPTPITREEQILNKIAEGGGGSSVEVEALSVTENGTYSEEGKAYSPVTVNVESGGGGDVSLTKIGTVTITSSSVSCYLIGGLWKDSQGNLDYRFGYITGSGTKSLDLYAPAGTSEVMVMSIQQNGSYMGMMNWTMVSGSVTKSTYYMTISGDCSISFYD